MTSNFKGQLPNTFVRLIIIVVVSTGIFYEIDGDHEMGWLFIFPAYVIGIIILSFIVMFLFNPATKIVKGLSIALALPLVFGVLYIYYPGFSAYMHANESLEYTLKFKENIKSEDIKTIQNELPYRWRLSGAAFRPSNPNVMWFLAWNLHYYTGQINT